MLKPILDSTGTPVRSSTKLLSQVFDQRNTPMMSGPAGKSLLSGFSGGKGDKYGLKQAGYSRFASDVEMANPSIRSPLLNQSNFYMPESDSSTGEPNRLLNQWISYYFKWSGLVGNIISMHAELPLSRFALRGIEDPEILHFYEEMVESMELHLKMIELLKQYFLYGEVAPFAFWSDDYNCFTDLTFLDTNYLYVKGHYLLHSDDGDDVEFYELEPDMMLQQIVKSDDYVTRRLREYLDDDFIASVRNNKRLLLSNFSTHMIKNKVKYSDLRGTSIVLRCLKSLLYGDKLREAQYSVADAHINPKWIWKLGQAGDLAQGGYMPSEDDLDAFRELLIQANNDPIFTIITHYAVNVEAVGLNGKLLPTKEELKYIQDEIIVALFANTAVTTGQGMNFATASVAFRAMMSRYIPIRAKVERYLYQKIFAPVAFANKFFKRKQADLDHGVRTNQGMNELIIPQIDWRSKANLLDDGSVKSIIAAQVSNGKLPMRLLTEALDIDYDEAQSYLFAEQGTVFDPVAIEARKRATAEVKDQTLMGQPFLPKTNSPVSVPEVEPIAKVASKKSKAADRLLTIQPLTTEQNIQTKIDQGKPEVGGNPEIPDPMAKALELKAGVAAKNSNAKNSDSDDKKEALENKDKKVKGRVFELTTGKNKRKLSKQLIAKQFKKRAETHEIDIVKEDDDDES